MRKNQKGFTLVELIIAVAILAIVTLSVCGFIVVGSRSYTSANTDIMLQQEAQLALNQISDVIIDTTESINYGSGTEMVLKDSEFSSEPDEKDLVVINGHGGLAPTDSSLQNNNLCYQFEWRKDTETIYFRDSEAVITESHPKPNEDEWNDWAILAQHVKELHIDISQFEENRVVMVSMTFQNGNKEYTTSNNVTVRNRVAINKIDVDPMKKAQEFTITTVKNVTLEPGDNFNLADKTQVMTTSDDDAVKWELVDPGTTTSTISPDGQLSIGTSETRQSFLVRVSRENEEYENQNNKVAKTVKVNIKRVNSVDLSCSATTVKAGSTITINGIASGYLLGASCEAHSCLSDDENKDHDLVPERWRIVRGPATIVDDTRDVKKVEIKISTSAKKGDEIEIEATSDLSTRKSYGIVTGTLVLKVTEGANGAKFIGSELKFGTDNDPGIFDYMRSHLRTDHWRYVFCIRIRESGASDYKQDWVMLYYTLAANERFVPDIFGLDQTKTYEIYFQVLDPRPKGSSSEASKEEIINEYFDDANLDDSGKYIGTKFEADEFYYAIISPPAVGVEVDGVQYPNENTNDRDRYVHFIIQGNNGVGGPVLGKITPQSAINIDFNTILNSMAYTAYKEDENGNWIRVYGVSFDDTPSVSQRTGTERIGALNPDVANKREFTGQREFGDIVFENFGSSMTIKRNSSGNPQPACGIYHIVPGFVYTNNLYIRGDYYLKDVIYKKAPDDYSTYYYKQWDAVINLKIDMGINLQLPTVNGEERWTYFPTPSDRAFPFDLESGQEQSTYYTFTQYSKNYEDRGRLGDGNTIVSCTYNAAIDEYTITLKKMEISGKQIKTHVYGVYTCKIGQDKWTRIRDEYDLPETMETNLTFTKNGEKYDTYFPAPLKGDFPFRSDVLEEQVKERWQFIEFKQNGGSVEMEKCDVKCIYANDTYSIQLITIKKSNTHKIYIYNYGTFTCGRNGTEWIYQSGTGGVEEGTDLQSNVVVTVDNTKYNTYFPAPSDASFPLKVRDSVTYTLPMYMPTDLEGYNCRNQQVTAVYDRNSGELEFRKEEKKGDHWIQITGYGKYTYDVTAKRWVDIAGYQIGIRDVGKWDATLVLFNDDKYMLELPLPSESGFPSFSGDSFELNSQNIVFYAADDVCGKTTLWGWGHRKYTYDSATQKYQLKMQMWYNGQEYNITWECLKNGTAWTKVN